MMKVDVELINKFMAGHPEEAARALELLDPGSAGDLLSTAEPGTGASALQHVLPQTAADLLSHMDFDSAAMLAKELPFDAQLVFLHRVDAEVRDELLDRMDAGHARTLRRLIAYPRGSAGQLMKTSPLIVKASDTVSAARRRLRRSAGSLRYYVYVIDDQRRLVGVTTLRQLLLANGRDPVTAAMESNPVSLPATASTRDIVKHTAWREFHSLPIVDANDELIGLITYATYQRLRKIEQQSDASHGISSTLISLGELFWLGMTGTLDALTARRISTPPRD